MADFLKKIRRDFAENLRRGETFQAAVLVFPAGAIRSRAVFSAGSILGPRVAEKMMKPRGAEHADSSSRPIAAMLPSSRQLHLAVTSKRLVAFGSGLISNKPTELQGEIQLSALKAIDVEKKKLGSRMVLHFSDGSTAEFDVHRSANTQAFVDAAKKRRRG